MAVFSETAALDSVSDCYGSALALITSPATTTPALVDLEKPMKSLRLSVLVFLLTWSGALLAQTSASISGTVSDPSGAAVQGATVTATELATGAVRSATSNPTGFYSLPNLAPGKYSVTVQKGGFGPTEFTE